MSEGNGLPEDHELALRLDHEAEAEALIKQHGEGPWIVAVRQQMLAFVISNLTLALDQDEHDLDELRRMRELVGMLIELGEAMPQEAESG